MDERTQEIIEQLTQRKLQYSREVLQDAGIASSGSRSALRARLAKAIGEERIETCSLQALLDELDSWGDQRIRLAKLPAAALTEFQSAEAVEREAAEAGMRHLLNGEIALTPPQELTPMAVRYEETDGHRLLRLIAAKTRVLTVPVSDVPDHFEEGYPGITFKPFRQETQKAVSFAEVQLDTGLVIASTPQIRRGLQYKSEFQEFFGVFSPLVCLQRAQSIPLYAANRHISELPAERVFVFGRQARSRHGGKLDSRSHSLKADMRTDEDLHRAHTSLQGEPGVFCNCFWEPVDGLKERVHTLIFGCEGEISILGQVREASARNVLRCILEAS